MKTTYEFKNIDVFADVKNHLTVTRDAYNKDKVFVGVTVYKDINDNPAYIGEYKWDWSDDFEAVEVIVSRYDLENHPKRVYRKLSNAVMKKTAFATFSDYRKCLRRRKLRNAEYEKNFSVTEHSSGENLKDQQITIADLL